MWVRAAPSTMSKAIDQAAREFFDSKKRSVAQPSEVAGAGQFIGLGSRVTDDTLQALRDAMQVQHLVVISLKKRKKTYAIKVQDFSASAVRVEFDRAPSKKEVPARVQTILLRMITRDVPRDPPPAKPDATLGQRILQLEGQRDELITANGPRVGMIVGYTLFGVGAIAAIGGGASRGSCGGPFIGGTCDTAAVFIIGGGLIGVAGLVTAIASTVNAVRNRHRIEELDEQIEALNATAAPNAARDLPMRLRVGPRFAQLSFAF